jgi:hypothetical protein
MTGLCHIGKKRNLHHFPKKVQKKADTPDHQGERNGGPPPVSDLQKNH